MERARTVIIGFAVLAVVAGGAHCGPVAPDNGIESLELPDEVRWLDATRAVNDPSVRLQLDTNREDHLRRAVASVDSRVTSSATGPHGTRYVAGIFSGALRMGEAVVSSHGGDDVFLARIGAEGDVVWARAVGGKGDESGAKVSFEDGRVKLLAMTDGAVDCGRGPLQTWSSEAFFLCTFAPDGAPIDGASFPTGRR